MIFDPKFFHQLYYSRFIYRRCRLYFYAFGGVYRRVFTMILPPCYFVERRLINHTDHCYA